MKLRRPHGGGIISFIFLLLRLSSAAWGQEAEKPVPHLRFYGSVNNYLLSDSHPFFGAERRTWMETSARMGTVIPFRGVEFELGLLGLKTAGLDPFGSGTAAGALGRPPRFELDKALIRLPRLGSLPVKLTVGRQEIALGSQFLIGDAVFDGYSTRRGQAVYHNPRRSFDAVRAEWRHRGLDFDSFLYRMDATWDAGGKSDGLFGGLNLSRVADGKTTYSAGMFYRHSPSKADNNMTVANLRVERSILSLPGLYAAGELVVEFAGRCRNPLYCSTPGQSMGSTAGHAEVGFERARHPRKPFGELGYVWFSKDYTPVAMGFSDWGKWYLGNQIDWIIFGHNTRIVRAQAGLWLHSTVKLRVQYHHTALLAAPSPAARGSLSNEFSYIAQWTPHKMFWLDFVLGDSIPGRALNGSGLGNPFSTLNPGAQALGHRRSNGAVLATGWTF